MALPNVVRDADERMDVAPDRADANLPLEAALDAPAAAEATILCHSHACAEEAQIVRRMHVRNVGGSNRGERSCRERLRFMCCYDIWVDSRQMTRYLSMDAGAPLITRMPEKFLRRSGRPR